MLVTTWLNLQRVRETYNFLYNFSRAFDFIVYFLKSLEWCYKEFVFIDLLQVKGICFSVEF